MNISSIQTGQIQQNAVRHEEKKHVYAEGKGITSSERTSSRSLSTGSSSPQMQAIGISASINALQQDLDLILVQYPPFFPIGTYQRLDLIKKVKGLQEEVERSEISPDLKKTYSGMIITETASDAEIASALERLFELRDALSNGEPASPGTVRPGSILNIKA